MWTRRRAAEQEKTEGAFEFRRRSVAAALSIDLEDPPEPPAYFVGREPTTRSERGSRRHPARLPEALDADALLEEFAADAEAGIPDDWLGRHVGLSRDQVARWRKRHGIERTSGRPSHAQLGPMAADVFGRETKPLVIPIASRVKGRWEPPKYLHLDYRRFAELVYSLVERGFAVRTIADRFGFRPRDIEDACRLWAARKRGAP